MTTFKETLRNSSENDLLIMQNNHTRYSREEVIAFVKEIDERGLTSDDSEELKKIYGYEDQLEFENPDTEFEKDITFLVENEENQKSKNKILNAAQAIGITTTFLLVFMMFGGPRMLGMRGRLFEAFYFGLLKLLPFIILEFFAIWGFLIAKKYTISIVSAGLLFLTLIFGTVYFY